MMKLFKRRLFLTVAFVAIVSSVFRINFDTTEFHSIAKIQQHKQLQRAQLTNPVIDVETDSECGDDELPVFAIVPSPVVTKVLPEPPYADVRQVTVHFRELPSHYPPIYLVNGNFRL